MSRRAWSGIAPAAGLIALTLAACGQAAASPTGLRSYLAQVEPIRLGVNRLLQDADPILDGYREHRLTGNEAAAAMSRLEQSFATYMLDVNAIEPSDPTLARINAPYAHTYILEDSYLNALVAALPSGQFADLPDTQSEQRAAIIDWRVQLEALAQEQSVVLPADLQQAGRGEIAPSITGSS